MPPAAPQSDRFLTKLDSLLQKKMHSRTADVVVILTFSQCAGIAEISTTHLATPDEQRTASKLKLEPRNSNGFSYLMDA